MGHIILKPGEKVFYNDVEVVIINIVDLDTISVRECARNIIHTIQVKEVTPLKEIITYDIPEALTSKEWELALKRYEIIKPVLEGANKKYKVKIEALKNNVSPDTIHRWVKIYTLNRTVAALANKRKKPIKRLSAEVEDIIENCITKIYLSATRPSVEKLIWHIKKECKTYNLSPPHSTTIRRRVNALSPEKVIKARYGKEAAHNNFEPHKGKFPNADYPLSVIQIDHTQVDILLVDETEREPYGRPYLTIAIDVFSRMIVGFYLSFDPPSFLSVGICLSNAILPKEKLLESYDIKESWPCWGFPKKIHSDNGKEFKSNSLKKCAENYGIILEYRPPAKPRYGGHVESLLGTFAHWIHDLPGTTFSNIKERGDYKPSKHASITLSEFERWFITLILLYHQTKHSGIGMPPITKYKEGVMGNGSTPGTGLPPRETNETKIRLDFLPQFERTIQQYGISIDNIGYYDDVLRKYINSVDKIGRVSIKKKFVFKRDSRDISCVYFYDPELKNYYKIRARDVRFPKISIWEYRTIAKKLIASENDVNEQNIIDLRNRMDEIVDYSKKLTKQFKRANISTIVDRREDAIKNLLSNDISHIKSNDFDIEDWKNIKPYEDIDDGLPER
ncbi:MAG: transposase [Flavobacterium johnsoniae]|nr:MAG: transposase [Flavobacterium johnsoniae]